MPIQKSRNTKSSNSSTSTRPVMRPVQRIIPPFGGVDISPVIVIIVLVGVQRFLLPMIFAPLQHLIG